jgi:hypothetical protein
MALINRALAEIAAECRARQSRLREFYQMAAASAPEPRKRKPKGSG